MQVSAINVQHLDALKTWLDSCNVKFYEGPANLNWTQIMKHINEIGLEGFYVTAAEHRTLDELLKHGTWDETSDETTRAPVSHPCCKLPPSMCCTCTDTPRAAMQLGRRADRPSCVALEPLRVDDAVRRAV